MHDLLHDLAVSEQTKCLVKPGGQLQRIAAEDCQGLRRISLMKNEISTINNGIGCPGLRSLLLSHNDRLTSISASFFDNMRYLSVLDLSLTGIKSLPHSIGNLKLLKYLNISGTPITELPKSLSRLRHLQFLDVSYSNVTRLHPGIDQHKHMLHLNLDNIWADDYPVGISKLIYLQTLKGVRFTVGNATASANALQLRDLKGLTHLQHLSLTLDTATYEYRMEDEGTFRGMTKMRTLNVLCRGEVLHLPNDMEAMERLEIVHLEFCVVPKWISQLQNLMELRLVGPFNSSSADLTGLEKIPHLKKLHLDGNATSKLTEFPNEFGEAGAFLRLEELLIHRFRYLKKIPSFQEDAMPMLKCVRIKDCCPLENVPEGLTKLKNLKEVEVEMLVDDVENFEYDKRHCWQTFKDQQIKIKVEISNRSYSHPRSRRLL